MSRSRSYRIHKANPGAFEGFSLLQLGMTQLNLVGGIPTPLKNDGVRQLGWLKHVPVTTNQQLIIFQYVDELQLVYIHAFTVVDARTSSKTPAGDKEAKFSSRNRASSCQSLRKTRWIWRAKRNWRHPQITQCESTYFIHLFYVYCWKYYTRSQTWPTFLCVNALQIGVPTLAIFSAKAGVLRSKFLCHSLDSTSKIGHYESIKIHLWPCDSGLFGLTCESKAWKTIVIQRMKCKILSWNVRWICGAESTSI